MGALPPFFKRYFMRPKNEVMQMEYQNPDASYPLFIPVLVINNTPDEELARNIQINTAKNLTWLQSKPAHHGVAVIVGGGASIEDDIDKIRYRASLGTVFAMNAASQWLHKQDIEVDYQCIIDAKEETASLIDFKAKRHLIGSQVNPKTMEAVDDPIVWHLEIGEIENLFPQEKVAQGGYVLLGGGASVGNSALCAAYALGFREMHIFGFDSCHKDGKSHAYPQSMNNFIPTIEVKWGDKAFTASVAMKAQAEKFQITSRALKELGCTLHVYGEGLLQTMYNTPYEDMTEQQKYQYMWQVDAYRDGSPGERVADFFVNRFKPDGMVIDYGCGTGRGGLAISRHGINVLLMDFADNCRDEEAQCLPFIQWDLTKPIPQNSKYGFCTDVMEHIPTKDVPVVIKNIMRASEEVFFQISTIDDSFGVILNTHLHLTVKEHAWWKELFTSLGYTIAFESAHEVASLFYIRRK